MRNLLVVLATLLGLAGPAWADAGSEFDAGMAADSRGDLNTAIVHFTEAIELKPDNAKATTTAALSMTARGSTIRPSPTTTKLYRSIPV